MKEFFKLILWIIAIILMASFSFLAAKEIKVFELILDFGNDFTFIHATYTNKSFCADKAKNISKTEKVKAYCLERRF